MNNKEVYINSNTRELPLFHQPFWMNAVSGDNWDVVVLQDADVVIATMPYAFKRNFSGLHIYMPVLTQFLGPHFSIQSESTREKINRETEILSKLVAQLPAFATCEMRWHFNYENWLPFHWKKFKQTTRYTYVIPDLNDSAKVWNGFNEKIRREIKKGEQLFKLKTENILIDDFYSLLKENLKSKNYNITFDQSLLSKIYNSCLKNNAGKIYAAEDVNGNMVAAIFVAWDQHVAYYIIGGKEPDSGNSGAMSFLFWNALKNLSTKVSAFDFEGSMIEGVESYFRSFGAEQRTFFQLQKFNSSLAFLRHEVKSVLSFLFSKH